MNKITIFITLSYIAIGLCAASCRFGETEAEKKARLEKDSIQNLTGRIANVILTDPFAERSYYNIVNLRKYIETRKGHKCSDSALPFSMYHYGFGSEGGGKDYHMALYFGTQHFIQAFPVDDIYSWWLINEFRRDNKKGCEKCQEAEEYVLKKTLNLERNINYILQTDSIFRYNINGRSKVHNYTVSLMDALYAGMLWEKRVTDKYIDSMYKKNTHTYNVYHGISIDSCKRIAQRLKNDYTQNKGPNTLFYNRGGNVYYKIVIADGKNFPQATIEICNKEYIEMFFY